MPKALTAKDLELLRQLQQHPDLSMGDIGQRLGISQSQCSRRISELTASGHIKGRAWVLSRRQLPLWTADVTLDVTGSDKPARDALATLIRSQPLILEAHTVLGQQAIMLRVVAATLDDLQAFLLDEIAAWPGVRSLDSRIAHGEIKLTTNLPLDKISASA